MLMVAIIDYGKELTIQPAKSIEWIKYLKNRVLPHCDFVIHDSNLLCPVKLDNATRELSESEVLEFMRSEAYPALEAEGKVRKKNGRFVRMATNNVQIVI